MTKEIAELSRAEWLIMNRCWRQGRCTARQIYDNIPAQKAWSYQTVKTMLDRLVNKGYLQREKLGPLCLYKPVVLRANILSRAIDIFLDTILGRKLAPLFEHLADEELSEDEISLLKKLIREHDLKHENRKRDR
jgi:BlaI family transcriptional regulator, penicillinase repressor